MSARAARICREALLVAVVLAGLAPAAPAREARAANPTLVRADAAFEAGERDLARRLYRSVLASDPDNSRATFQLAKLAPRGSAEALALLRRYVALEPSDPWGNMALGDDLARAGRVEAAIEQYALARRRAPTEPDVYAGFGRILRDAGRIDEAVDSFERWVSLRPGDPSAWFELGRARERAARHPEAARAYARALRIKTDERTEKRLEDALAESSPSLRPLFGSSDDSDGNRVERLGFEAEWPFTDRSRLGVRWDRYEVSDALAEGTASALALYAKWRPLAALAVEGSAGTARLRAPGSAGASHTLLGLRIRGKQSAQGLSGELRMARNPLIATPGLIAQPVQLSEVKGTAEVPLFGPFRARVRGQRGELESPVDVNHRSGYQVGPVYQWRPATEFGAFYGEQGYDHPSTAGYFAPRRVQLLELGTYLEYEGLWPLSLALDAGAGRQRVARHGEPVGEWTTTYRLWALASWTLQPGVRLELELEHYDSPLAGVGVSSAAEWRYDSVTLSLRFGVQREHARAYLARGADRPPAAGR